VAGWIAQVLNHIGNEGLQKEIKGRVRELCAKFPIYR
jgi:glycine/serine hydroxymethyltransferase